MVVEERITIRRIPGAVKGKTGILRNHK